MPPDCRKHMSMGVHPEHWYVFEQPRVYAPPAAGHDPRQAGLSGLSEEEWMLPRMRRCTSNPIITDFAVVVACAVVVCHAA